MQHITIMLKYKSDQNSSSTSLRDQNLIAKAVLGLIKANRVQNRAIKFRLQFQQNLIDIIIQIVAAFELKKVKVKTSKFFKFKE